MFDSLKQWFSLSHEVLGNPIEQWLVAIGVFLVVLVLLRVAYALVCSRVKRLAEQTTTAWDNGVVEALEATRWWFRVVMALYVGSLVLTLPDRVRGVVESIAIVTLLIQAALWINVLLRFSLDHYVEKRAETDASARTTVTAMAFVGRIAVWTVVLLLALDNIGVDVTALIAGLGVGGIAVALAAQNILGDLFASLSIVLDKPFVLGDFIIVGDLMGTVEHIGLKTTRLRSLSGEQLIFSNTDLLKTRIRNFKRMYRRRVVFSLGVTYQTPHEKLRSIPAVIRQIVESQDKTQFDRSHFKEYGDSALNFETVYHVLEPDYALYMDIQQAVNLAIYERFESEGIEFAYPTRTLFVQQNS